MTLEDILAAAERHLAEAESQVANHRERVAQLERDGLDAAEPTRLLLKLELQALHVADRERLLVQARIAEPMTSLSP